MDEKSTIHYQMEPNWKIKNRLIFNNDSNWK